MSRSRDIADSTKTLDVDGGTIKLDGNYPVGSQNVALGDAALDDGSLSGSYNTALGAASFGNLTSGTANLAVGAYAGQNHTTGSYNVFVGEEAAVGNTTGSSNTAVGRTALYSNTTANYNTAMGRQAAYSNTTGEQNLALGGLAFYTNTTGSYNVALGMESLKANTTASNNTAVGFRAGYSGTTSASNTLIGKQAGYSLTTANGNTFIGTQSGDTVTTGQNNTILGRYNGNQGGLDIRTSSNHIVLSDGDGNPRFYYTGSSNYWNLGTTNGNVVGNNVAGMNLYDSGMLGISRDSSTPFKVNRKGNDGNLVEFYQAAALEGTISVSSNTVSYNGFSGLHESSGIPTSTPVGTVVSTIDELDVYADTQGSGDDEVPCPKAGQTRADHAKVKVSDTVEDSCVYGVVANFNEQGKVNVVSVGIGSVRVTGACSGGDLLESNGDGTAKVQSDDIIRSKTIGKVTIGDSNTGVKLVSCVLYCG